MAKKPMYQYIVEELTKKIKNAEYAPNQPLPTQIELAKLYDTSEITSRRALAELVNAGLIYRKRGKGTFVAPMPEQKTEIMDTPSVNRIYFVYANAPVRDFNHRFFNDLLVGIYEQCSANGIEFIAWDYGENADVPNHPDSGYIILTNDRQSNGIPMHALEQWKEEKRRLITVHFYYPHLHIPYVVADNMTGGYLATHHLISLGHKNIGIILTGKSMFDVNQEFSLRVEGYKLALAQNNVPFNSSYVYVADGEEEREEMGYDGVMHFMQMEQPPTAVFVTSDYKALGAYRAIRQLKLNIPEDISIVGYDDILFSRYVSPQLTTVNQKSKKLGKRAFELLVHKWADNSPETLLKDEIVPELIVRQSTAPIVARSATSSSP